MENQKLQEQINLLNTQVSAQGNQIEHFKQSVDDHRNASKNVIQQMKNEQRNGNALQISKDIDAMEKQRKRERKEKDREQYKSDQDFLDLDVDINLD